MQLFHRYKLKSSEIPQVGIWESCTLGDCTECEDKKKGGKMEERIAKDEKEIAI